VTTTPASGPVVAAVDIGTNSTNLLVVDAGGATLERLVTVTRLGRGVDARGVIDDASATTTLRCIAGYREVWESFGADRVHVVATSATRDASNGSAFLDQVASVTGSRPEVLSGEREAALAYRGVTASRGGAGSPRGADEWFRGSHLLLDIGGGSTELVLGGAGANGRPELAGVHSLDVGAVRLTERHLRGDPPRPEELLNAIGDVHDALEEATLLDPRLATPGVVVDVPAPSSPSPPSRSVSPQTIDVPSSRGWTDSDSNARRSRTCSEPSPPSRWPTGCTTPVCPPTVPT